MSCEHRFVPFPGSARKLYCEHCGEGRDTEARAPKTASKPPRHPRTPGPGPLEPILPFGVPLPIGERSPIEGDGTPTRAELEALEQSFSGGASPLSQAAELARMAEARGLHRVPDGDPPGTYRPGTEETPPWMQPRI